MSADRPAAGAAPADGAVRARVAARATTVAATIVPGPPSPLGYRTLARAAGEPLAARTDLGGAAPSGPFRSLLVFVHLSDLHVTDPQSPARAEFLDRHGDPDSPLAAALGRIGTYRAQEMLTYQVVEAMVRAVRELDGGPLTGAPPAFAVSTGDATDNSQANELEAYVALLDGGSEVVPDSGDSRRYEGVGAEEPYDPRYWHPDGTPPGADDDVPRRRHGLPVVHGLLDACRAPFVATGLGLDWYAVFGNHDAMLGGTLPVTPALAARAVGGDKPVGLDEGVDVLGLLADNETRPSTEEWGVATGPTRPVTPDARRRPVPVGEWIAAHLPGHGYDEVAAAAERAHYAFDAGSIRCVVLDTVNRAGGWQGSLTAEQLAWLEAELAAGHSRHLDALGDEVATEAPDRLFVLFSHHSLETLVNDHSPDGALRHLADDVRALLARFPNVVAWFNGHTHVHSVTPLPAGGGGLWQVTTASHVDWPQQSRVVELALDETSGDLVVGTAVFDHAGALDPRAGELRDPVTLAGWSRELAANAWQGRVPAGGTDGGAAPGREPRWAAEPVGRGAAADRNVVLVVPAPFPLGDTVTAGAISARDAAQS
ncbi:MAG TPA: TIGR03767 family metallophosphoesterase [Acidimicrobiales bacterium]|nr:TIGR03767 family metallophosphoesterase [Acidimicrobiales bacterium]